MDPPTPSTTFGTQEADDLLAALDFIKSLKGDSQSHLVADSFGVYGVELGSYAALRAANQDSRIKALVLDSVPRDADDMVNAAVRTDVGLNSDLLLKLARFATRTYFVGGYDNKASCELAKGLKNQRILLLAGADAERLRESSTQLQACFPTANLEAKLDLPLSGFTLTSATGEQGERYDRPVIEFFLKNLP